jgi:hypothetical protein
VLLRQLPAGHVPLSVDPGSIPDGWKVRSTVIVDLPEMPSTAKVQVVLEPR